MKSKPNGFFPAGPSGKTEARNGLLEKRATAGWNVFNDVRKHVAAFSEILGLRACREKKALPAEI